MENKKVQLHGARHLIMAMNFSVDDVKEFADYLSFLEYDPEATLEMHFQASSLYWSDEIPDFADRKYPHDLKIFYVYLLSYRKVLMYGGEVEQFKPLWNQLKDCCPDWPGFRPERFSRDMIETHEMKETEMIEFLEREIEKLCARRRREERKTSQR